MILQLCWNTDQVLCGAISGYVTIYHRHNIDSMPLRCYLKWILLMKAAICDRLLYIHIIHINFFCSLVRLQDEKNQILTTNAWLNLVSGEIIVIVINLWSLVSACQANFLCDFIFITPFSIIYAHIVAVEHSSMDMLSWWYLHHHQLADLSSNYGFNSNRSA